MPKDNIPEIRVRGFSDEWKQRKLNELIMYQSSNLTASDASDIGKYDLYDANTIIGKTNIEPIRSEYITVIKDGAGVGRIRVLPPNTMFIGTMGGLQATKSDLSYIYTLLSRFELGKECSGSTIPHIYFKDYGNNEYFVPTIEEQQTIGSYFAKIDNLITLHQRKYDALVSVKKAMLEKMFPKAGETVPEIRFAGFTDPWEQRKLGEIGEVITGSTPSTQHPEYYSEDGMPWVTPTDIVDNIIYDTPRKLSPIGEKVGRVVPADTILVTCIASIGKNAMLVNTGSFNQQINSLVPDKKKYDPYFLLTESFHWSAKMKREAAAGTMQIVNKNEFSAIETYVPELSEQKAIGAYFCQIDKLITLHQRKCVALKNLKSALLSKMFV